MGENQGRVLTWEGEREVNGEEKVGLGWGGVNNTEDVWKVHRGSFNIYLKLYMMHICVPKCIYFKWSYANCGENASSKIHGWANETLDARHKVATLKLLVRGIQKTPKPVWAIVIVLGCLPELNLLLHCWRHYILWTSDLEEMSWIWPERLLPEDELS